MECAVYDTYVTKKDGRIMHFDVVVDASTTTPEGNRLRKEYPFTAGQGGKKWTQEECQYLLTYRKHRHCRKRHRRKGLLDSKDGGLSP